MTKKNECCFDVGGRICFALTKKECFNCKFRKTREEFFQGIRDYPLRSDIDVSVLKDFVNSLV